MPIYTIFVNVGNERIRFDIPVTKFQRRVRITTIHGFDEECIIRCDELDIVSYYNIYSINIHTQVTRQNE